MCTLCCARPRTGGKGGKTPDTPYQIVPTSSKAAVEKVTLDDDADDLFGKIPANTQQNGTHAKTLAKTPSRPICAHRLHPIVPFTAPEDRGVSRQGSESASQSPTKSRAANFTLEAHCLTGEQRRKVHEVLEQQVDAKCNDGDPEIDHLERPNSLQTEDNSEISPGLIIMLQPPREGTDTNADDLRSKSNADTPSQDGPGSTMINKILAKEYSLNPCCSLRSQIDINISRSRRKPPQLDHFSSDSVSRAFMVSAVYKAESNTHLQKYDVSEPLGNCLTLSVLRFAPKTKLLLALWGYGFRDAASLDGYHRASLHGEWLRFLTANLSEVACRAGFSQLPILLFGVCEDVCLDIDTIDEIALENAQPPTTPAHVARGKRKASAGVYYCDDCVRNNTWSLLGYKAGLKFTGDPVIGRSSKGCTYLLGKPAGNGEWEVVPDGPLDISPEQDGDNLSNDGTPNDTSSHGDEMADLFGKTTGPVKKPQKDNVKANIDRDGIDTLSGNNICPGVEILSSTKLKLQRVDKGLF